MYVTESRTAKNVDMIRTSRTKNEQDVTSHMFQSSPSTVHIRLDSFYIFQSTVTNIKTVQRIIHLATGAFLFKFVPIFPSDPPLNRRDPLVKTINHCASLAGDISFLPLTVGNDPPEEQEPPMWPASLGGDALWLWTVVAATATTLLHPGPSPPSQHNQAVLVICIWTNRCSCLCLCLHISHECLARCFFCYLLHLHLRPQNATYVFFYLPSTGTI